jgi:hypothetical protein
MMTIECAWMTLLFLMNLWKCGFFYVPYKVFRTKLYKMSAVSEIYVLVFIVRYVPWTL